VPGVSYSLPPTFTSHFLPAVRYVDVQNAPLNISFIFDVRAYLVYLRVNNGTGALLHEVNYQQVEFPNLQTLDLGMNNIKTANMTCSSCLPNLKVLRLSNNPLAVLYVHDKHIGVVPPVQLLDVSHTELKTLDTITFHFFSSLQELNMSHSLVQSISGEGFAQFPHLQELDLRGNPFNEFQFSDKIFRGLTKLSVIYTPNYRMCCADTLTSLEIKPSCFTDETTLSSCGDLLRSQAHQVTLTLSLIAVIGNTVCDSASLQVQRTCCKPHI
jgi:hypothetical protein